MKYEPIAKDYTPESMSYISGFGGPRGDVGYWMEADYEKAVDIINDLLLKSDKKIVMVEMGLDGDWTENSCIIYENGDFIGYDCYSGSQWAQPIILVEYEDGSNEVYSAWYKIER